MRKYPRALAVLATLAMVAGACGDDRDDDQTATTTTTTEAETQQVEIVGVDYAFSEVPENLSAGVIDLSFDNQGEVAHEVALVEIGDTPLEQFLEDFPPVLEGGPFPDYAEHVAVPIEVEGGESADVTFTLAEGTYALFCALDGDADADAEGSGVEGVEGGEGGEGEEGASGPAHYERGMAQVLTVGPGEADPALPEADGSITAVDYGFEIDVAAGDQRINYVNEGPEEVHFAAVSVFPEGTDAAAAEASFQKLLESPPDGPPPEGVIEPEEFGFSGIFSPGLGAAFEVPGDGFESGRTYLVVCFIQDRSGGPPHAVGHEMYEVFTVE